MQMVENPDEVWGHGSVKDTLVRKTSPRRIREDDGGRGYPFVIDDDELNGFLETKTCTTISEHLKKVQEARQMDTA